MMNDERRGEEEGMPSEGSRRWRGNEAGMRAISFQDVRKLCRGSEVSACVRLPPGTGRGGLVRRSRSISSLSRPGGGRGGERERERERVC